MISHRLISPSPGQTTNLYRQCSNISGLKFDRLFTALLSASKAPSTAETSTLDHSKNHHQYSNMSYNSMARSCLLDNVVPSFADNSGLKSRFLKAKLSPGVISFRSCFHSSAPNEFEKESNITAVDIPTETKPSETCSNVRPSEMCSNIKSIEMAMNPRISGVIEKERPQLRSIEMKMNPIISGPTEKQRPQLRSIEMEMNPRISGPTTEKEVPRWRSIEMKPRTTRPTENEHPQRNEIKMNPIISGPIEQERPQWRSVEMEKNPRISGTTEKECPQWRSIEMEMNPIISETSTEKQRPQWRSTEMEMNPRISEPTAEKKSPQWKNFEMEMNPRISGPTEKERPQWRSIEMKPRISRPTEKERLQSNEIKMNTIISGPTEKKSPQWRSIEMETKQKISETDCQEPKTRSTEENTRLFYMNGRLAESNISPLEFDEKTGSINFAREIKEETKGDYFGGNVYSRQTIEQNADIVHIKLMRNNAYVTVTDYKGNKKVGASAGLLAAMRGGPKISRYSAEATAEYVGRLAKEKGLKSVVVKVNGFTFFKKKKQAILGFRDGYTNCRNDQNPIVYVEDITRRAHNGCRLRKKRRRKRH